MYIFFISLIDIKPKMVKLTLEKNDISEKFRRFFEKFRLNSKEILELLCTGRQKGNASGVALRSHGHGQLRRK